MNFVGHTESLNNQNDNKLAILDSGCSTTVSGKVWIQEFINKYGKDVVMKREQDDELFMFGSSKVYQSEEKIALKIKMSSLVCTIRVSVIDASIPLLIGNDVMVGLGISLINDIHKHESYIQIGIINKTLRKKGNGHWRINIEGVKKKNKNHVFVQTRQNKEKERSDNENDASSQESIYSKKDIIKIHQQSHKSKEQIEALLRASNTWNSSVKQLLEEVTDDCIVCKRYKVTPPVPKSAFPKATSFNEIISLDLKDMKDRSNVYILYMLDEYSKYMKARVVNTKHPEEIIKTFNDAWIEEGPGLPTIGIFSDNGGEFKNKDMTEYSQKLGLKLYLTAAHSPFSNGSMERNHFTIDLTISKMMEDDNTLKLEDALRKAVYAYNCQIRKRDLVLIK